MDDDIKKLEEKIAALPEEHPVRSLFEISLAKLKQRKVVKEERAKSNPLSENN